MIDSLYLACRDIIEGVWQWRLWVMLGWKDIRLRYHRTVFGPFWQTLSQGVFVGALGFVFSKFWGVDVKHYLPFLAGGVMTWFYITVLMSEGCSTFMLATAFIKNRRLPYSTHVYRAVFRNFIVFLHSVPIYIIVAYWAGIRLGWDALFAIPGILLLTINGVWVGLLLGALSARFRDVPNIIGNALTVSFFITPIHWEPHQMTSRRPFIVDANPFHHLLEVVRAPLLGQPIQPLSWYVVGGITVVGSLIGIAAFARMRARIAYWL